MIETAAPLALFDAIPAGDDIEESARRTALTLAGSGASMIRQSTAKPDPHLVAYLAVTDGTHILLGDHVKSGLWLPPGGHVEPGESPRDCALRECSEELGLTLPLVQETPVFVSLQKTIGVDPHHDLSLWFLMQAAPEQTFDFDTAEFTRLSWCAPEALPKGHEPQLPRFLSKMARLGHISGPLS